MTENKNDETPSLFIGNLKELGENSWKLMKENANKDIILKPSFSKKIQQTNKKKIIYDNQLSTLNIKIKLKIYCVKLFNKIKSYCSVYSAALGKNI
jgi:hypothetical protein